MAKPCSVVITLRVMKLITRSVMTTLLLLSGCLSPVREQVDRDICSKAELPIDQDPRSLKPVAYASGSDVLFVAAQEKDIKPETSIEKRLKLPKDVPAS